MLRAAGGAVKQREGEGVLILKSLRHVNVLKFLAQGVPLFEGILFDYFPRVVLSEA